MRQQITWRRRQQGYLMLLAVFFILVIGVMGTLMAYILAVRAPISVAQQNGFQALYLAESGLEIGTRLLTMPSINGTPARLACGELTGNSQVTNAALMQGTFTLTALAGSPTYAYSALTAGINNTTTTIPLNSTSGFAASGSIIIDGEIINYKEIAGNSLMNARRGVSSLASAHGSGAIVAQYQCAINSQAGIPSIASPIYQRELSWKVQMQDAWVAADRQGNALSLVNWNRLNEISWTSASISASPRTRADLRGISMLSHAEGWAVGDEANREFTFVYWNGADWTRNALAGACNGQNLKGVSMVSHSEGWAVGTRYISLCLGVGLSRYTILRWNGNTWNVLSALTSPSIPIDSLNNQNLNAIHVKDTAGNGVGNLGFAVGDSGTMLRYNGSSWTSLSSSTSQNLKGVNIVSALEAWAVGDNGTILRWNGSSWGAVSSPTASDLNAIAMLDTNGNGLANLGWAVGNGGTIISYNGSNWSVVASETSSNLNGVGIYKANDAWAVGASGTTQHWDGSSWSSLNTPGLTSSLNAISLIPTGSRPVSDWRQTFH